MLPPPPLPSAGLQLPGSNPFLPHMLLGAMPALLGLNNSGDNFHKRWGMITAMGNDHCMAGVHFNKIGFDYLKILKQIYFQKLPHLVTLTHKYSGYYLKKIVTRIFQK